MKIALVNLYELGRQPFGLAHAAAWLERDGHEVACLDLALDRLDAERLRDAGLVALYIPMHTATRLAVEALPRVRALAPRARLAVYGLYAPMNEDLFRALGVDAVLGGEFEPALASLARRVQAGDGADQSEPVVSLAKVAFIAPARAHLPALKRYAHLKLPDGDARTVGFIEGSRGCKHLCRHCPVVPVYEGRFSVVPVEVAMQDVRAQAAMGATHFSFGDPDFFNGPTHALRLTRALHAEFPHASFDATIKIQHLIAHAELLPELRRNGCLFVTSAVESVDDTILEYLRKNHTDADFETAVRLARAAGIALAPTFVPFTPWTTRAGYLRLLERLVELKLVESVPPIQLAIRLLVPRGSRLFEIPDFDRVVGEFDARLLGYPWRHPDPDVDALQQRVQAIAETLADAPRAQAFAEIWRLAHAAAGRTARALPADLGAPIPHLSEPWYCCAEPTSAQRQGI